jgi:hypothetical protein
MKITIHTFLLLAALGLGSNALAKGAACKFSDEAKLKDHVTNHIKYPAKGKDIKAACKKELPDEFTKEERACVAGKIKSGADYKDAGEVLKALGVNP